MSCEEEKQYTVLQNVIFYEPANTISNNYNCLPVSQYRLNVDNLPSTSESNYLIHSYDNNWDNSTQFVELEMARQDSANLNRTVNNREVVQFETPKKSSAVGVVSSDSTPVAPNSNAEKPTLSFVCLIGLAFRNSKDICLAVKDIYDFIECVFPYYRMANTGWRSSVRHNLSFSDFFLKVATERAAGRTRGYIWRINSDREMELRDLVNCGLEREKTNTINSMFAPEQFELLRDGKLRLDSLPLFNGTSYSVDGNNLSLSNPRSYSLGGYVARSQPNSPRIIQAARTQFRYATPLKSYSTQNTPQRATNERSLLSSLLGIKDSV